MSDPRHIDPPSAPHSSAPIGNEEIPLFPASFGSAERFFAALTQSIGSLTTYVDADERVGYVCGYYAEWFGLPAEQLVGKSLKDIYTAEEYAAFSPWVQRALHGEEVHYERRAFKPDGTVYWISVNLRPYRDAGGKVIGAFSAALDVQDLKRTHDALDQALHELEFLIENSPLAMIEWTGGDVVIKRWSRQAQAIFGWREDEVLGKHPRDIGLVHEASQATIQAATRELTDGKVRRNRMLARNVTKDGRIIDCEWFNSAFTSEKGTTTSILSLVQDVTLRMEAEQQLREVAVHDSLTGLANRESLIARLEHAVSRARRGGMHLALMFIDLDKFKAVNDNHGHAVGDALLKWVAQGLRTCVREVDTVARLGGDEFVVLLETDVKPETPEVIKRRIEEALAQGFDHDGLHLPCFASIGISFYPADAEDAEQLLASADEAMYRAKQHAHP